MVDLRFLVREIVEISKKAVNLNFSLKTEIGESIKQGVEEYHDSIPSGRNEIINISYVSDL